MAERYLIDTSAVIKYLNQTFTAGAISFMDKILDEECNISFISEIELQVWKPVKTNDIVIYQQFVRSSNILGLNKNIIEKTIEIKRDYKLKIADALIAATAAADGFTLIADNDKDFLKVLNLKYVNPRNIN